jgi:hypothetical protein
LLLYLLHNNHQVTATYYLVSSYWKAFASALTGALAVRLVTMGFGADYDLSLAAYFFQPAAASSSSNSTSSGSSGSGGGGNGGACRSWSHSWDARMQGAKFYTLKGLLLSAAIGVTCGLFAALFVKAVALILRAKKRCLSGGGSWWARRVAPRLGVMLPAFDEIGPRGHKAFVDLSFPLLVILLTAAVRFPGSAGLMEPGNKALFAGLFATNSTLGPSWHSYGALGAAYNSSALGVAGAGSAAVERGWLRGDDAADACALLWFILSHLLIAALSVTLAVPCGVFIPAFACGAAIGRLLALVCAAVPFLAGANLDPGAYAVVGAGAMAGGTTMTISASVLTLEMMGQFHHALPSFLAVLCAMGTSKALGTPSIYDAVLRFKKLPFLAAATVSGALAAEDAMRPCADADGDGALDFCLPLAGCTLGMAVDALRDRGDADGGDAHYHPVPVVSDAARAFFYGIATRATLGEELEAAFVARGLLAALAAEPWSRVYEPDEGARREWQRRQVERANKAAAAGGKGGALQKVSSAMHDATERLHNMLQRRGGGGGGGGGGGAAKMAMQHGPGSPELMSGVAELMADGCELRSVREEFEGDDDGDYDNQGDGGGAAPALYVLQRAPFTVQPTTPLSDVHVMFTMLGCRVIYVADYGRLVGCIETKHLLAVERRVADQQSHAHGHGAAAVAPPSPPLQGSAGRNDGLPIMRVQGGVARDATSTVGATDKQLRLGQQRRESKRGTKVVL